MNFRTVDAWLVASAIGAVVFLASIALFSWLLPGCTASQRQVIRAKEVRLEQDCQRLEDNPLTPQIEKFACINADIAFTIVSRVPPGEGGCP